MNEAVQNKILALAGEADRQPAEHMVAILREWDAYFRSRGIVDHQQMAELRTIVENRQRRGLPLITPPRRITE